MSSNAPTVEISIAMVSWINDRLKESIVQREQERRLRFVRWRRSAAATLAAGFSGLCVLLRW